MSKGWRWVPYKDAVGEWRASLVAPNNKRVVDCGDGYSRRVDCLKAITLVQRHADAPVVPVDA